MLVAYGRPHRTEDGLEAAGDDECLWVSIVLQRINDQTAYSERVDLNGADPRDIGYRMMWQKA